MSALYDIRQEMLDLIDPETGDIADFERFEALTMERDEKLENIALWIINLLSDAEQYKAERQKFEERERAAKHRAESLKAYLDGFLAGDKFQTPRVRVSYRTASAVVVEDATMLEERFMRRKDPEPNKTAIKAAIDAGEAVRGAHIEQRKSIVIK